MSDKELLEAAADALDAMEHMHQRELVNGLVMDFAGKISALRAALAQEALDRLAETNRELGLDYAEPLAQDAEPEMPSRENRFKDNYIINDPLPTAYIVGNKIMDAPPAVTDAMVDAARAAWMDPAAALTEPWRWRAAIEAALAAKEK